MKAKGGDYASPGRDTTTREEMSSRLQSARTARPPSTGRSENPQPTDRSKLSARASARGSSAVSNYQQVKNALTFVCLAGGHAEEDRTAALKILDEVNKERHAVDLQSSVAIHQFLILLHKSKTLSFRGVYGLDSRTGEALKLFGRGPRLLDLALAEEFHKYESSTRSFKAIATNSLTSTTDAVSIDWSKLKK